MIYEETYGMSRTPFVRNVPAEDLYEPRFMGETLSRLHFVAQNQQFAVITADSGCGKSTLLRKFNEQLPKDKYVLLYISDSKLSPKWLYTSLLDQLGLESGFYRGDAKKMLQKQVSIIQNKEHRKVVIILDEAHLLEKETLEEFRFLLNSEFDSVSQMALILAGQTELWDNKLRYRRYEAIRQRIDVSIVLPHLNRAETEQYILTHMKYAGCDHPVFTEKAIDEIFRTSTGIERMINKICEKSLIYSAQQRLQLIDEHAVRYVEEHEMIQVGE